MAKISFDIKYRPQIESGEYKVETRSGRSVRIVCWDRVAKENTDDDLNLCVLVPEHGGEAIYYYHRTGKKWVPDERFDLFLVTPESELSEFEKAVGNLLIIAEGRDHYEGQAEHIKKVAAELLELAKGELTKQGNLILPIEAFEKRYVEAQEKGRKEALKDLPRWSPNDIYPELNNVVIGSIGTDEHFFIHRGRIIHLESLEKLPGF